MPAEATDKGADPVQPSRTLQAKDPGHTQNSNRFTVTCHRPSGPPAPQTTIGQAEPRTPTQPQQSFQNKEHRQPLGKQNQGPQLSLSSPSRTKTPEEALARPAACHWCETFCAHRAAVSSQAATPTL
ncbi:hypothetical protein D623_10016309 [Myotis brandtii]|uniref:Uncharacterized protein n=1 Tax=Myotis brandtii TaxID=109478 RepID=S7P5Z2_MYOBR|nr:hypothetical protein D623_10016309 [Myotis brandtii]